MNSYNLFHKKTNSNFIPYLQERDGLGKLLQYKNKSKICHTTRLINKSKQFKETYADGYFWDISDARKAQTLSYLVLNKYRSMNNKTTYQTLHSHCSNQNVQNDFNKNPQSDQQSLETPFCKTTPGELELDNSQINFSKFLYKVPKNQESQNDSLQRINVQKNENNLSYCFRSSGHQDLLIKSIDKAVPGMGYYTPKTTLIYPRLIKNIILYNQPQKQMKTESTSIINEMPIVDTMKQQTNFYNFSKQLPRNHNRNLSKTARASNLQFAKTVDQIEQEAKFESYLYNIQDNSKFSLKISPKLQPLNEKSIKEATKKILQDYLFSE